MKGLYLSNIDPQQSIGYMPKILGQLKGLRQLGYDMDLICFNQNSHIILTCCYQSNGQLLESKVLEQSDSNLFFRRLKLLRSTIQHISNTRPSFLYLRYPRSEPLYICFLAKIRKKFPNLIILSEFPTYPYDKEYSRKVHFKDKIVFFLDKVTRPYLKHFIDKIVAINYEGKIFGIDAISIDNGIKIEDYTPINSRPALLNTINLIGVANVSSWHGYDRLIKGLGNYYRKCSSSDYKVNFYIIGAQAAYLDELIGLTTQEKVTQAVIFHEPTQGEKLDFLFESCHLAVGVLGGHRKELAVMSPLKNREYCARGIPFFFSHIDPDFSNGFRYCFQIDSNDRPIDVEALTKFITQLSSDKDVVSKMRNYAHENLDWSIKLKAVQAYINEQ